MARRDLRHPAGIDGPWFVDDRCIDCDAARQVAPGLIARNPGDGVSVFTRQPQTDDEVTMAWRCRAGLSDALGRPRDDPAATTGSLARFARSGLRFDRLFCGHGWSHDAPAELFHDHLDDLFARMPTQR
jgi:hypothetical protein